MCNCCSCITSLKSWRKIVDYIIFCTLLFLALYQVHLSVKKVFEHKTTTSTTRSVKVLQCVLTYLVLKKGFVSRGCRQLVLTGTYKIVLIKGSMYVLCSANTIKCSLRTNLVDKPWLTIVK